MEDLISVIIPVYNVQKYLRRCLNSVKNQTYKNLEIILVDDGSTDKSPKICDEFARKDRRFKVIHKRNEGVSSARNVGLKSMGGGYLTFVDSDDWLPRDSINILYTKIKKTNADLCCGNYYKVYALGKKAYKKFSDNEFSITYLDNLAAFMATSFVSWAKMFKASCIKFGFPNDLLVNEDTYFVCSYLQHCDKIVTTKNFIYYHNKLNENSLTHKYYPALNEYYVKPLGLRNQLFAGTFPVSEAEAIIELFIVALRHYITHLPRNEAIIKIKETHCIFRPYLQLLGLKSLGQSQSNYIQRYNLCYDDLQAQNYESVYRLLEVSKEKGKTKFTGFVEKSILLITDFIVFKLQLGYKK